MHDNDAYMVSITAAAHAQLRTHEPLARAHRLFGRIICLLLHRVRIPHIVKGQKILESNRWRFVTSDELATILINLF